MMSEDERSSGPAPHCSEAAPLPLDDAGPGAATVAKRPARRLKRTLAVSTTVGTEPPPKRRRLPRTLTQSSVDPESSRFSPAAFDAGLCLARVWNGGSGGQCHCKPVVGSFCKRHKEQQTHGRIDGPIPPEILRRFQKAILHPNEEARPAPSPQAQSEPAASQPQTIPELSGASLPQAQPSPPELLRERTATAFEATVETAVVKQRRTPRAHRISRPALATEKVCLAGDDILEMPASLRILAKRGGADVDVLPAKHSD